MIKIWVAVLVLSHGKMKFGLLGEKPDTPSFISLTVAAGEYRTEMECLASLRETRKNIPDDSVRPGTVILRGKACVEVSKDVRGE